MVCTTIQNKSYGEICDLLAGLEMAEIRLDTCSLSLGQIDDIFASEIPLVATCRIAVAESNLAGNDSPSGPHGPVVSGEDEPATLPTLNADELHRTALEECRDRLVAAVEAGASYVDVEDDAPKEILDAVKRAAHKYGTVLIVSHHDFSGTPSYEELKALTEECFRKGAEVVKIVTTAHSQEDCERVERLYYDFGPAGLLAFCMGEAGRQTRVECLRRGARFTYAALDGSQPAAPGQWPTSETVKAVYGDRIFFGHTNLGPIREFSSTRPVSEEFSADNSGPASGRTPNPEPAPDSPAIPMPSSKSFAQRAIIAAALAEGESHLYGYTPCSDSEAAIAVARSLGAEVVRVPYGTGRQNNGAKSPNGESKFQNGPMSEDPNRTCQLTIRGIAARPESLDINRLNVGESGLLARLMIPLSAILSTRDITIEGEGTLKTRPLKASDEIMSCFGIRLSSDTVPLKISGTFTEGRAEVTGKEGSQLISGLLMAGPLAGSDSLITVTDPKSIPYMFITLDILRKFGVETGCEMDGGGFTEEDGGWGKCREITFNVTGKQKYKAADIDLEGDWSAAANFLVAGAVFGRAAIGNLDTSSLQADISIMDILIGAGANPVQLDDYSCSEAVCGEAEYVDGSHANLEAAESDSRGTLIIQRAPLTAFEADLSDCPDLFPITSVFAAFCAGTTRIEGLDRLAHKESDRGAAIIGMLTKMGVKTYIEGNELVIEGHSLAQRCLTDNLLHGGNYSSHHDHRMAMALKVASLGADGPIVIDDEACVGKSYPSFNETFQKLI